MAVLETHWDLIIETDVPGQLTSRCGCGWSKVINHADAPAIVEARRQWTDHDCGGRAMRKLQDAFPGSEIVSG